MARSQNPLGVELREPLVRKGLAYPGPRAVGDSLKKLTFAKMGQRIYDPCDNSVRKIDNGTISVLGGLQSVGVSTIIGIHRERTLNVLADKSLLTHGSA